MHTMGGRITENNEQGESKNALNDSETKCHALGPHSPSTLETRFGGERIAMLLQLLNILVGVRVGRCLRPASGELGGHMKVII